MSVSRIFARRNERNNMDVVRQLLAIAVVFGLLWLALWLLKRKGTIRTSARGTNSHAIQSCGRLALTAQHSLHLIRAGDRRVLLGLHSTGFTVICDMPDCGAADQVSRP